ncbi:hypothetical protein AGMMS4956_12930 [Bacteroidia bacterium]|nr:hypothetical protein AGMMS4956_12930 [Bacteroidia bacterium]
MGAAAAYAQGAGPWYNIGSSGSNITATLSGGTLTLTGSGGMEMNIESTVPWRDVSSQITSVIISEGIISIGQSAFYGCENLTSVSIPNSVTYIDGRAFYSCPNLTSVTIPDAVTNIGYQAFYRTGLTSVSIPDNVTSIGNEAFGWCERLKTITIGSGIGSTSLYGGSNFGSVFESDSLTAINIAPDNTIFSSVGGVLFDKAQTTLLVYPKGKQGAYNSIPNTVTTIDDEAFYYCYGLTGITLNNVATIGNKAFQGCGGLTSLTLPATVTTIGDYAFDNCWLLSKVTVENATPQTIGSGAFPFTTADLYVPTATAKTDYEANGNWNFRRIIEVGTTPAPVPFNCGLINPTDVIATLNGDTLTITGTGAMENFPYWGSAPWNNYVNSITVVKINSGVTTVGDNAFVEGFGITSLTIPNTVASIGDYAFYGCSGLTSLTLPNGVTTIGNNAFNSCIGLTSLTIGSAVTSIGNDAFYYCIGLTSVTIPNGVTVIGDYAFGGCEGLTTINVGNTNAKYSSIDGVLFNKAQDTLILYPGGKKGAYQMPNSVTSFGYAFESHSGLTSIIIGDSVTAIDNYAFYGCSELTSVTIGSAVASIGNEAFNSCIGLTSVTIDSALTTIGNRAFAYCQALRSVYNNNPTPQTITGLNVFDGVVLDSVDLYVPNAAAKALYEAADVWKDFKSVRAIVPVTGVTLNKTTLALVVGADETLTATVAPTDATNKAVTWSTSNAAVATVSETGVVTAVAAGTATITVTTEDGSHTASCAVTVTAAAGGGETPGGETPTSVEAQTIASLHIYPNPTSDQITVNSDQWNAGDKVEIYNVNGSLVGAYSIRPTINIAHLPAGIYIVKVGNKVAKVVKQ